MTSFDKSADLSGWADKYIRNPINSWLDKRVRKPVQEGFVQPAQKLIETNKEPLRNSFTPIKQNADYVMKQVPAYIGQELGEGYRGYYQPLTMENINPINAVGMVAGGVADRYSHDYSTNADGTPNTDKPTMFSFLSDVGRNVTRNLAFDSDMPGTTRLPFLGKVNNSTMANFAALPASATMYADMMLPKGTASKLIPGISKKPVPIADMSDAKRYRMLKKLRQRKAQLVREQSSPTRLLEEYKALEQDPENYISFNAYYDKRKPELDALYAKKMNEISDAEEQLYPWLGGKQFGSKRRPDLVRTGTGTHRNPSGDFDYYGAWMDTGEKFGSDPDARIWRNIGRYGHMFPRFLMRTHRDGRWNTAKEQAQSFATDAVGDYLSNFLTWGITDETLPAFGSRIHPALGAFLRRNASGIRTGLNTYIMGANQRDALQSAIGKAPEEYIPMPNFRSYFSKKLHDAANAIPTLNDVINKINTITSPDVAENQGVYIPGSTNPSVQ